MIRRVNWKEGDSSPDSKEVKLDVSGDGSVKIDTGFIVSTANVFLSRTYVDAIINSGGSVEDIFISVTEIYDDGFLLEYKGVPSGVDLEIGYLVM